MFRILAPLGFLALGLSMSRADILSDLSAADQQKVKSGQQVVLAEPLDGYPWPRVRLYQYANATPREVMAIFTDYNNACKFVPNCLKSKISKDVDSCTSEVDYLIDVPILADEAYTVRNTLSQQSGGSLLVTWKLLKATSILESEGSLLVEPAGEGSMLRYTNLVKPSSRAAGLLKGVALGQMKNTVKTIVEETERQKEKPGALDADLKRLDAALGSAKD